MWSLGRREDSSAGPRIANGNESSVGARGISPPERLRRGRQSRAVAAARHQMIWVQPKSLEWSDGVGLAGRLKRRCMEDRVREAAMRESHPGAWTKDAKIPVPPKSAPEPTMDLRGQRSQPRSDSASTDCSQSGKSSHASRCPQSPSANWRQKRLAASHEPDATRRGIRCDERGRREESPSQRETRLSGETDDTA